MFLKSDGWRFETRLAKDLWKILKESWESNFKIERNCFTSTSWFVLINFNLFWKRNISLLRWWSASQLTCHFCKLFDKEVWIVSLKIVKYDWKNHWFSTWKIAGVVCCSTIISSKVTMVSDFELGWFFTVEYFITNVANLLTLSNSSCSFFVSLWFWFLVVIFVNLVC